MNDQRFIELVNLYIDREITSAETAELEIEIQSNPRRRAIYNQYCKLNRATSMVYDSFRAQAEPVKRAAGQATIEKFESAKRRRRVSWGMYFGGIAAAACVAFALIQFKHLSGPSPVSLPTEGPSVAAQVSTVPAVADGATTARETQSGATVQLASLRRDAAMEENFADLISTLQQSDQRAFADASIKLNRTPSLFEDGVFETKSTPSSFNQRTLRSQSSSQSPQAEFTAFQFQR